MPSSCGPTLAPLPPSWWQMAQFFSKTWAPRAGSALATTGTVAAAVEQVAELLVGGREALEQRGDALGDARAGPSFPG